MNLISIHSVCPLVSELSSAELGSVQIQRETSKIRCCGSRSPPENQEFDHLQRTAKKCTKMYNARAELLHCSLNLLFSDVLVAIAVVVC